MSRPSAASATSATSAGQTQSSSSPLGSPTLLTDYDPLEIIGNGSFGIIRKVRRKSDGVILARKELNFERMTERDRKQIVAEVNILKDLQHENIVRYHDRFVDRPAGILYILMEYCGGGDLSGLIKQSRRLKQAIPEDTIWAYLTQLLYALCYCHHPGVGLPKRGAADEGGDQDCREGKQVILHRDLKPENVFIDTNGTLKLGDFGLSKAISTSAFANTYVGTPYYMSPELINDSPYDTKSDIWSLGCLIYELCAWNPPFHAAQTHSELAVHIRSGKIPPLPKQYSSALGQVIKSMLSLTPHGRPSAMSLMTHERVAQCHQILGTQKMYNLVKNKKQLLYQREAAIAAREEACAAREGEITAQITHLREEGTRLDSLREQLHTEIRSYQQDATRFHHEVQAWNEVKDREREAIEKDRQEFNDTAERARREFESAVAQYVESRAEELVRERMEAVRAEERRRAEEAVRAEYAKREEGQGQQAQENRPSRVPRRSLGKRALEELPSNLFQFPGSNRRKASFDLDTPTRSQTTMPPVPLVKETPLGRHRLATKSMVNLSSTKRLSMSGSVPPPMPETPLPTRDAPAQDSPSVSSAKKIARRLTMTTTAPRPPLPSHANTCPAPLPIWNPDSLPSPPIWDFEDEENLPSPFIKKLPAAVQTKSKSVSDSGSGAKKGLLARAVANAAAGTGTGKETQQQQQQTVYPLSSGLGMGAKGPRPSLVRAQRAAEEARVRHENARLRL